MNRTVIIIICAVMIVGIGLGVLVRNITKPSPQPVEEARPVTVKSTADINMEAPKPIVESLPSDIVKPEGAAEAIKEEIIDRAISEGESEEAAESEEQDKPLGPPLPEEPVALMPPPAPEKSVEITEPPAGAGVMFPVNPIDVPSAPPGVISGSQTGSPPVPGSSQPHPIEPPGTGTEGGNTAAARVITSFTPKYSQTGPGAGEGTTPPSAPPVGDPNNAPYTGNQ